VLKWQEFWDAFEASVHKANYTPIDKLNYHIAQNSGGEKLWQISHFKVLARKTLANA